MVDQMPGETPPTAPRIQDMHGRLDRYLTQRPSMKLAARNHLCLFMFGAQVRTRLVVNSVFASEIVTHINPYSAPFRPRLQKPFSNQDYIVPRACVALANDDFVKQIPVGQCVARKFPPRRCSLGVLGLPRLAGTRHSKLSPILGTVALAILTLFAAVGRWNAWFDGMILITKNAQYPIMTFLRTVVIDMNLQILSVNNQDIYNLSDRSIRAANIVVATLPILIVYPFLQRYFIHGIRLGAVKG